MNLRVKDLCKQQGITLSDLADRMNMKRESLSRAINGNPTLESLEKIAKALEVDITELFTVANDELYGIIIYKGEHYRIDSLNSLKAIIKTIEDGANVDISI